MQVTVPRPDVKGRTEILNWYLSKIKVDSSKCEMQTVKCGLEFFCGKRQLSVKYIVNKIAFFFFYCKLKNVLFVCCCERPHCLYPLKTIFFCFPGAAVEAEIIARGTVGFSGAELENLVNQAALKAAMDGKEMVTMKDLEFAKDKILMGECTMCLNL